MCITTSYTMNGALSTPAEVIKVFILCYIGTYLPNSKDALKKKYGPSYRAALLLTYKA